MAALVASPNCSIKCTFLGYPRFLSGLDRRFNRGEHIAKIIHLTFTKLLKQPAINNFFFFNAVMFIATCHTFQQQRSDKASSDMSFDAEAKLGLAKLSPSCVFPWVLLLSKNFFLNHRVVWTRRECGTRSRPVLPRQNFWWQVRSDTSPGK